MSTNQLTYEHIQGKTYTLFGNNNDTTAFYKYISLFSDNLLEIENDPVILLNNIIKASKGKNHYNNWVNNNKDRFDFSEFENRLSVYIGDIKGHLDNLKFSKIFEKTLSLKKYQYLLYMIEIELTNRINIFNFKNSEYRIALLPHCLHDLSKKCIAESDGLETVCKRCSKSCYLRLISDILKSNNIQPYIWTTIKLKSLFKKLFQDYRSVAVLGIACIPELVNGLRKCNKYEIPAIGIPLNANRCVRWMGDFYNNSVDLLKLEELINPAREIKK